jgi:L-histidine N-alpha-methyltransferase
VTPDTLLNSFAADVARDLERSPKQLQAQYLYDALGSSLFDAICRLPWYRITRAEECLLSLHASDIASRVGHPNELAIVELGVGNGEKLATLIDAMPETSTAVAHLIDISDAALSATSARLSRFPFVSVVRYQDTYERGLARFVNRPESTGARLVLFLGSNIGNFDGSAALDLLRSMRHALRSGDCLLLGADLVKPEADLILAYDDPLGVTAAFNKNLLVRINRELGANFDLATFTHRATWNQAQQRVEMHLVSQRRQEIHIPAAALHVYFSSGETIWTESSYKYTESALADLGASAGFSVIEQWIETDARFALTLFGAR